MRAAWRLQMLFLWLRAEMTTHTNIFHQLLKETLLSTPPPPTHTHTPTSYIPKHAIKEYVFLFADK